MQRVVYRWGFGWIAALHIPVHRPLLRDVLLREGACEGALITLCDERGDTATNSASN
jgi:hypothetical protein